MGGAAAARLRIPQTPQYGQQPPPYLGPAPYQQPQPPKKKSPAGKIVGFGCLGVVALFVIIGIAAAAAGGGDDDSSSTTADSSASAPEKPAADAKDKPADKPKTDLSQAERFKAFVAKSGTPTEKTAAKHITKVQGADDSNDILDSAEVYTDYAGGMMGPHQADGKLLASAFADWKDSKNGLVTVYDAKGEILSNGQY